MFGRERTQRAQNNPVFTRIARMEIFYRRDMLLFSPDVFMLATASQGDIIVKFAAKVLIVGGCGRGGGGMICAISQHGSRC
jgi:hypothetical protein